MALSLLGGVLVIVILVFCVLVVVMAPLRSPLFGSFVRGFTSKDAKSDEEMQEQIKSINWKKGFFRLTLVLSILFGFCAGMVNAEPRDHHSIDRFLVTFFIVFGLIWFVYFVLNYIIRNLAGRVTFVLSILFGVLAGIFNVAVELNKYHSKETFLVTFFTIFGLTWLVYFIVRFVNRGFISKK
ncbi:hypothetical protein C6503_00605 [Candidatus Poribacteria bacterium]|nr:MAG: hypothetical protein C6503_00605 [Candidatus Poribacteria bacterium]